MPSEAELQEELNAIGDTLGPIYRRRDEILAALAELRGEYELPKPRYQTDRQRLVASCPRCGTRISPKEKAAP